MAAMKTVLNSKQVKPKEIRKNYYAASLFLDKVLDALICEAAMAKIGDIGEDADLDPVKGEQFSASISCTTFDITKIINTEVLGGDDGGIYSYNVLLTDLSRTNRISFMVYKFLIF